MDWTEHEPPPKPDIYVVARFLDALAQAPDGYPRTRLQAAVRLNYDLYRSYLGLLGRKGFIEAREEGDRIVLTPAGSAAHARLVGWIRDAFGEIRL